MDNEATTTEVAIERSTDPSEIVLLFIDGGSRELHLGLSNIEPDDDTGDAALLRLAADIIDKYGGIKEFVDASLEASAPDE